MTRKWEIKTNIFEYCQGWKALYGDIDLCVIFAAAGFLKCSQQHAVDVLAVASLGTCSAAAAA